MKTYRIRKDDKVMVITGKDAGKIGKVLKVLPKKDRVLVEKVNVAKRHMRPNPYAQQPGGIVDDLAGHTGGNQFVLRQNAQIGCAELRHQLLAGIVGNYCDSHS